MQEAIERSLDVAPHALELCPGRDANARLHRHPYVRRLFDLDARGQHPPLVQVLAQARLGGGRQPQFGLQRRFDGNPLVFLRDRLVHLDVPVELRTHRRGHRRNDHQLHGVRRRGRRVVGAGLQAAHAANAFDVTRQVLVVVGGHRAIACAQQCRRAQLGIVQALRFEASADCAAVDDSGDVGQRGLKDLHAAGRDVAAHAAARAIAAHANRCAARRDSAELRFGSIALADSWPKLHAARDGVKYIVAVARLGIAKV